MNLVLKKDVKSFVIVIIFGILMGSLCAVLDLFPYDNIWTFSSFSGSLGFWAITGMIVLMQSDNYKLAGINTFLYFAFMNAFFFFVYLLLPIAHPRITTFLDASISALYWTIPSFICGICAIITYQAKKNNWRVSEKALFILCMIGGSIGGIVGMYVFRHKTKKWYFKYGFPAILIIQILIAIIR